jgi:broad specificity phosphatase PhoE
MRESGRSVTATILLIRHAAHAHLGKILSGRLAGIGLSEVGARQAARLAEQLAGEEIAAVQCSPVQRAQETAAAIAGTRGLAVETVEALNEIDFGDWTGSEFDALAGDPEWDRWNAARSVAVAPRGESMAAAQARVVRHLEVTAAANAGNTIAMVTHCDIIRAACAHVLGLSLDAVHRFDVDPASVTRLAVGEWGARVISINEVCR